MDSSLAADGYEIHRGVFSATQVEEFRKEADIVAKKANSVCVRHLRTYSDLFNQICRAEVIQNLTSRNLRPVRSILFDKTKQENWPVLWHQDLTISTAKQKNVPDYGPWSKKEGVSHVQPPVFLLENMITMRIHLDDTPEHNGALRVLPGSHKKGKVDSSEISALSKEGAVTCACSAGDVLLMRPLIIHSSKKSENPQRRRIIHFEYAQEDDLDKSLSWHEDS